MGFILKARLDNEIRVVTLIKLSLFNYCHFSHLDYSPLNEISYSCFITKAINITSENIEFAEVLQGYYKTTTSPYAERFTIMNFAKHESNITTGLPHCKGDESNRNIPDVNFTINF